MQCPRCSVAYEAFETAEGLTLDQCPQCRAMWFDAGELARMLGTAEDLPALEHTQGQSVSSALECPRCRGTALVRMPYAVGASVCVETCPMCQGTLVAREDLGPVRALASAASAQAAPRGLSAAPDGDFELANRSFRDLHRLTVKQRRRLLEMLTGFETPNEYNVIGNGMGSAFMVQEQTAGLAELLKRLFLGPARPFVSHVEDTRRGTIALKLVRPFRWFLSEMEVQDADGRRLARIARRWTWVSTRYEIFDARERCIGEIHGSFWRPWTFVLRAGETEVARVVKQWSGLTTEVFSDADNFEVTFDPKAPPHWKPLALAAAVLIDVVHFERSNK